MPALNWRVVGGHSRGHGDCHQAKHTKHNRVKEMFNPQASFSVQSFPLKSIEQPSKGLSSSSTVQNSQNSQNSYQYALAGPSSTKSTPSLASPDGLNANLVAYPKDRDEEELQVVQQTAAGCVEN